MLDDEIRTGTGPEYWNAVGASWNLDRQRLWRSHSDAVNSALLSRWLPAKRAERLLKTDLFDEMCTDGLYPLLSTHALSVVGMDLSVATLRGARSRHPALLGIAADVQQLPFAAGTFDLIVSISTLDHFQSVGEIRKSLAELSRVIRPGGELIITMDNPSNPLVAVRNALPYRLLNRLGITPYYVGATLNARDLRHLLEETGFTVMEDASVMHCLRVFAVALARLLGRYAPSWMQRSFLRMLMVFEHLGRLPSHRLTGHFTAVRATRRGQFLVEQRDNGVKI